MSGIQTAKPKRDYIGSAHIAGILGIDGAYGSPVSIAHQLKTGENDLDEDNLPDAVELGLELEEFVLRRYAKRERSEILQTQPHYRYPAWDCLGCTPDALVRGSDGVLRLVDAKVVGDYRWDEVPDRYEASSQWQIGIAHETNGVTECDLAVYHLPARMLKVYRVELNREWLDVAADRAIDWWRDYVIGGKIPPVDGKAATTAYMKRIPASTGKAVNLDHCPTLVDDLEAAEDVFKAAEEDRDFKRNLLFAEMGDAETVLIDGTPRFTWKQQAGRNSLDQKALEADYPEIFAQYVRRGKAFRVPRILKRKGS